MNATAHNLALGLLLGWLPILVLSSITDRSPASTDETRWALNYLLESVRLGLLYDLNQRLDIPIDNPGEYFTEFCGQGRCRWHYGIAHSILTGVENDFVARHGRGWLFHPDARRMLVSRQKYITSFHRFDLRELWEILCSVIIVGTSVFGAFILSYFTPTVGLGCRSGGYLVFFIFALAAFSAESTIWWGMPTDSPTRKRLGYLLDIIEVTNTCWLIYILGAQTFGLYRTCSCWSSNWARGGGYINFETTQFYKDHGILVYWSAGTVLSCTVMGFGFLYIVAGWCTQSHLWTVDYGNAMAGLKRTRRFKKYTIWFRCVPDWFIDRLWAYRPGFLDKNGGRRGLTWGWKTCN